MPFTCETIDANDLRFENVLDKEIEARMKREPGVPILRGEVRRELTERLGHQQLEIEESGHTLVSYRFL